MPVSESPSALASEHTESTQDTPDSWSTWPSSGRPVNVREWGTRRKKRSLIASTGIVAGAFVASRLLGLIREVILAQQFGTTEQFSAYVSAFRIPDLLFLVVMAGAFGSAFIPVFSGLLGNGEDAAAWRLASTVLNVSGVVVIVLAALAWLTAPTLVRYVVAPDANPTAQRITVDCMRILLLSPVFLGWGIAAKGILEEQDRFMMPALAPIIYNGATILGAVTLGPRIGVFGVAVGVVAGSIGFLLLQIPDLIRSGMRYSPSVDPRTPWLSEVGRLLAPRLIGQAAFQINFIVLTNLAWRTGGQSVSALNYAWQLLMLPHGVLALSVSTVLLPTLSRLWQAGEKDAFRARLASALQPLIFLSLPTSVVLFAFRTSIVQTLFQTGAFSAESTALVAAPLALLSLGLISYAVVELLTRAFYAMHDTRTPVAAGVAIIAINIAMGVLLLDRFGYLALAFALSASTTIEALILTMVLRHRLGSILPRLGSWLGRVLLATAATAVISWVFSPMLSEITTPGNAPRLLQLFLFAVGLAVVDIVYFGCAWILHIPEICQIVDHGLALRSRLGRGLVSARR